MASAVLEKAPNIKQFAVSVDEQSYLTFSVMGMSLKLPIEGKTIGEIHDSAQTLFQELLEIPGVKEILSKHGAIIERQ